jgi:hypothetical protein
MNRRTSVILLAGWVVAALTSLPIPASADESGAVTATVTVAAPCVLLTDTEIGYGVLPFSRDSEVARESGAGPMTVENCSGTTQLLFVRGTDATSINSSASWALTDPAGGTTNPCALRPNAYFHELSFEGNPVQFLTIADSPALAGYGQYEFGLTMPCVGSDGAGETFQMAVVFTAAF